MFKLFSLIISIFIYFSFTLPVFAGANDFVSIVNPVRGNDFWEEKNQTIDTSVKGQLEVLNKENLPATWLLRFDALKDQTILNLFKSSLKDEKGLFLEITPTWTKAANVNYIESPVWHNAGSAFLTGYSQEDRIKLIDKAFEEFKSIFGLYPKSVGAWWVDSFSAKYMQEKYGVTGVLIVADQYTTDNYQIWGQYWSTPYYPSIKDTLTPAQTKDTKIPVVVTQWAARDPVNAYGRGVNESTYSVQPNDYIDFHDLDINYFSKLIDIYTTQKFNRFGQIVVGLENSYSWENYKSEYQKQIEVLKNKSRQGQFKVVTMSNFSDWYISNFPSLSPEQIIVAEDPLGTNKKSVWFMNPYYRAGWFYNQVGSVFRDIRQYVENRVEPCFEKACKELFFATFATRVLDDVTYGTRWTVDEGEITNFSVERAEDKYNLNYVNEAGKTRMISFHPRDIEVDGVVSSIDGTILNAISQNKNTQESGKENINVGLKINYLNTLSSILKLILFTIFAVFIPGLLISRLLKSGSINLFTIFISFVLGIVSFTLFFYVLSLINLRILMYVYVLVALGLFIYKGYSREITGLRIFFNWKSLSVPFIIIAGSIFQYIPMVKSGLFYEYGIGYWGPNTHDGVWHLALINQLIEKVSPENPIFAGELLKNYHYFYDLLIAATFYVTKVGVSDLVFRFYPLIFSLLLGTGGFYLIRNIFYEHHLKYSIDEKQIKYDLYLSSFIGLFLMYFSGSFGWIVEFIKQRHFGGESAFWVNQSISFNLNPPFALSMVIVIAFINLFFVSLKNKSKTLALVMIVLLGSLLGFKAYASILLFLTIGLISLVFIFKKDFYYLSITFISGLMTLLLILLNFNVKSNVQGLFIFAPFWFIHSMVDAGDRVGWERLTLARIHSFENKQWFKFFAAESLSFTIFLVGNLGLRVFSLLSLFKLRTILRDPFYLFLFVFTSLGILIPILFIQAGNPWNTIQFFYYPLYIASLVSGVVLSFVLQKIPKVVRFLIIVAIVLIAPINSIMTSTSYFSLYPHARISSSEVEALQALSSQERGVVLTNPYDRDLKGQFLEPRPVFVYDATSYVSAYSKKPVFIEDEIQNDILLTDYKPRIIGSKEVFKVLSSPLFGDKYNETRDYLRQNNIKYIYWIKTFTEPKFEEEKIGLEKIFENEEVFIYKVK